MRDFLEKIFSPVDIQISDEEGEVTGSFSFQSGEVGYEIVTRPSLVMTGQQLYVLLELFLSFPLVENTSLPSEIEWPTFGKLVSWDSECALECVVSCDLPVPLEDAPESYSRQACLAILLLIEESHALESIWSENDLVVDGVILDTVAEC